MSLISPKSSSVSRTNSSQIYVSFHIYSHCPPPSLPSASFENPDTPFLVSTHRQKGAVLSGLLKTSIEKEAACLCWGKDLFQFLAFRWLLTIPRNPITHRRLGRSTWTVASIAFSTFPGLRQYSLAGRQDRRKLRDTFVLVSSLTNRAVMWHHPGLGRHSCPVLCVSFSPFFLYLLPNTGSKDHPKALLGL